MVDPVSPWAREQAAIEIEYEAFSRLTLGRPQAPSTPLTDVFAVRRKLMRAIREKEKQVAASRPERSTR
jgi:hypothetical protein